MLIWSLATVACMPLANFAVFRRLEFPFEVRQEIDQKVRGAAYAIIGGKGATYYGIGSALARITDAVLHDQRSVLTVCTPEADVLGVRHVTVSLPRLVGGAGVLETFPLPLRSRFALSKPSFPSSAWERASAKLCFASGSGTGREAELRPRAFPSRAWERGFRTRVSGISTEQSRFKTVVQAARLLLIAGEPPAPRGF